MASKSPLEQAQEFVQSAIALVPVIILGSGASAAYGIPGMGGLANHLSTSLIPTAWDAAAIAEWQALLNKLATGVDLESALGAVRLSDEQTTFVAEQTRGFLLKSDLDVFEAVLGNPDHLALARLFRHLFLTIHRTLDVITPNYDRLAEYAANAGGHVYFTGFTPGHIQIKCKQAGIRIFEGSEQVRTVNIWKVHGSLDWFRTAGLQTVAAPTCHNIPKGCASLMITPGVEKYRLTHGEPFRTIFAESDRAMEKARSYLCVGYGFNDQHVQEKLVERCNASATPMVIVTHTLSPTTHSLLASGRCKKYVAIESRGSGSFIRTHDCPGGFEVPGQEIWRFDQFLNFSIGS